MRKKTKEEIERDIAPIRNEFVSYDEFLNRVWRECGSRPVIILTEKARSPLSQSIIRFSRDSGDHMGYSHVIVGYKRGWSVEGEVLHGTILVAHQPFPLLREDEITKWLGNGYRLKAWVIDTNGAKQTKALAWIKSQIGLPAWKRTYDVLGVFGHLFRASWIQSPWRRYCSEFGMQVIRRITTPLLAKTTEHPSPNDLNRILKTGRCFPKWARPKVLARFDPEIPPIK